MLGDEFSMSYLRACQALQVTVMTELLKTQRELLGLADSVSDEADRSYALERVHLLAEDFGLEPMSLERREAEIALYSTDHYAGTRAEQLVAIASTRKKIWEIADRAGEDAHAIRYMTRALDGMEHDIEFSSSYPWNDDYDPRDVYNPPPRPVDNSHPSSDPTDIVSPMPLDIAAFNSAFSRARHKIKTEPETDIAAEQAALRLLVPDEASEHDRSWTTILIDRLAEPPEPEPEWSVLYREAGQVHADAYRFGAPVEEQIAALEEARRKIFEIADRAAPEEAPHIRAMTRSLEHIERELREPSWPVQPTPDQTE